MAGQPVPLALNPPPLLQIPPRPFQPPPPAPALNLLVPQPGLQVAGVPGQQPANLHPPVPAPPPSPDAEGSIGELLDPNWFRVVIMRCTAGLHDGKASVTLDRWQGTWNFLPNEFVESALHASSGLQVQHLILKHHCLTRLPANFAAPQTGFCSSLTILDLSHNHFVGLPEVVCQLVELKELFLNHNKVSQLPEQTSNLSKLETLHLQVNHLQSLPDCVCSLTALQYLNAEDNQIEVIPSNIGQLKQLRTLHLKCNNIAQLPHTITDLTMLEELHLSNNRLEKISLKGLTSLRQLHLAYNNLRFLPFSIVEMDLQGLTVSHNPLKFPPLSICRKGLSSLKAYMLEKYNYNREDKSVCENPYYDSNGDDTDYEDISS